MATTTLAGRSWPSCVQADSQCSSVYERPCTELSVEPCHPSQRYRVTVAPLVCSTEHTCGPTLQTDHIRPSSIFCCGSHSVEQYSCRIQRPDNQRCLLPTAFKDSSVRARARARFVYDYALCRFTFIIITSSSRNQGPGAQFTKYLTISLY